jgi:tetratricopeptide (TPR) repeat protein
LEPPPRPFIGVPPRIASFTGRADELDRLDAILMHDKPAAGGSFNNLGQLLQALGDLTGARPLLERALAIREKVLGPEHPDTARSFNNFAQLLQAQGDLAAARPLLERTLMVREKGPRPSASRYGGEPQ